MSLFCIAPDAIMLHHYINRFLEYCQVAASVRSIQIVGCVLRTKKIQWRIYYLNWAVFYSICTDLLRIKASQNSSTYPRVCLRFLQILMHQDLSTYLRKKSLNLGIINSVFVVHGMYPTWLQSKTLGDDFATAQCSALYMIIKPWLFHSLSCQALL